VRAAGLEEALGWLRDTGSGLPQGVPVYDMPRNVAAIELLFMRGPETVYTLLGPC